MKGKIEVEKEFLKKIGEHKMSVMLDSGIHRHIRFQREDTNNQWFEILTWPGHLTIAGDMGTWVFSRTPDMFEFFRRDDFSINEGYWSEKIQAYSKYEGPERQWDGEKFAKDLEDDFRERIKDSEWEDKKDEIWDNINEDVLCHDNQHESMMALRDFDYEGFTFGDDWYHNNGMDWSYHYLWCLYAIVWGIKKYDEVKH